jgi:hypothetical protein
LPWPLSVLAAIIESEAAIKQIRGFAKLERSFTSAHIGLNFKPYLNVIAVNAMYKV